MKYSKLFNEVKSLKDKVLDETEPDFLKGKSSDQIQKEKTMLVNFIIKNNLDDKLANIEEDKSNNTGGLTIIEFIKADKMLSQKYA